MKVDKRSNRQTASRKVIKKRSPFLRQMVMVVSVICILTAVVYASVGSVKGIFSIEHYDFSGNRHLTDDDLKTIMGLSGTENLIMLSFNDISERLFKSPWIKSVSIRKELPDKLLIKIEEAIPFALLDMKGHLYIVDKGGRLLEELRGDSLPFLPVISGDPFKEQKGFLEALNLVNAMKIDGLLSEKNHIEIIASKPHELEVLLDGIAIKVGAGNYEEKLTRIRELKDEIKKRKISVDYMDLRFANKVIVKPINEAIK